MREGRSGQRTRRAPAQPAVHDARNRAQRYRRLANPFEPLRVFSDDEVEQMVWQQLRTCFDPEIPFNIVDLGLVYEARLNHRDDGQREVEVKMTLTAPGCGMGEILVDDVRSKLEMIPTIAEADVELVFDPPWGRHMMSEAAKLETGML